MSQNKTAGEIANQKVIQIADNLVSYLIKHRHFSLDTAVKNGEWAANAARMANENLLVNMYESIAGRIATLETQTPKSQYLCIVHAFENGNYIVYFDAKAYIYAIEERLDMEKAE